MVVKTLPVATLFSHSSPRIADSHVYTVNGTNHVGETAQFIEPAAPGTDDH